MSLTVLITGATVLANLWIDHNSHDHIFTDANRVPKKQVAIVLGARVYRSGKPTAILEDRLRAALTLYRQGKVEKILVSGDHLAPEYDEVNAMWRWLSRYEVPSRDIFLDHAGIRTLDTMIRASEVFEVDSAVVCTQAFHLSRSVFLARRAGIDAVGIVADRRKYLHPRRNQVREYVAKTVAFLDSYVFRTHPRFGGDVIPISGDGRETHDIWTGKSTPKRPLNHL